MRFTLVAVGLGFVLALVLGGRLHNLTGRSLRLWFLLPLGLALQLAAIEGHGDAWPFLLVLGSYACLFAFAVGLNHGMPVGRKALNHVGRNGGVYAAEHHVQRSSDKLLILGDVVPVSPLGEIVSFGDLIFGVGLADVIVHLMRPARRRKEDEDEDLPTLPLLDSVVHS